MRVALVTNIPSPYRIPVWEAIYEATGSLDVFLCATTERNRVWDQGTRHLSEGVRFHVLPGVHWYLQRRDWGIHVNPGLPRALARVKPDAVVVTGYDTPSYLLAMRFALGSDTPLVLWWGSHALSSRSKAGVIAWLRRRAVRRASSYVTYGSLASEYLVSMGVPRERVITGTNTVDVERLHALVVKHLRDRSRRKNAPVRFLYVGQFIERKGVRELLHAFASLDSHEAVLALVGYGPLEQELRRAVRRRQMQNVVFMGKARTMEELAKHYADADVLVMPSLLEVWGLVVNEALASGLYVLSSKYAGATPDLVSTAPIKVGDVFDPLDQESFRHGLREAVNRIRAGLERGAIAHWGLRHTPGVYADAVCAAIELARGRCRTIDS